LHFQSSKRKGLLNVLHTLYHSCINHMPIFISPPHPVLHFPEYVHVLRCYCWQLHHQHCYHQFHQQYRCYGQNHQQYKCPHHQHHILLPCNNVWIINKIKYNLIPGEAISRSKEEPIVLVLINISGGFKGLILNLHFSSHIEFAL